MKNILLLICFTVALADSNSATAHHSVQEYDRETTVELEGIVSAVNIRNPHITLKIDTVDEKGDKKEWEVKGGSANAAARRGLNRNDIKVGDSVLIAGWPVKSGKRELGMTNILLPNGKEFTMRDLPLPLRWSDSALEAQANLVEKGSDRSLFRVWSAEGIYEVKGPFHFTEYALQARGKWLPERDIPAIHCIPPGMPRAILNPYPIEFVDRGNTLLLNIEEWEAIREIDMTASTPPEEVPGSLYGYSTGHWEGETLVVKTSKVDYPYMDYEGTPMSENTHITERFTVSDDGLYLNIHISVIDPTILQQPAVWHMKKRWVPNARIMPFECDTGTAETEIQ